HNDGVLEADGATLTVVSANEIEGGGEVLVTAGGTVDLSQATQLVGTMRYDGRGTIIGTSLVPAGEISGFSTGDAFIFGSASGISGALTATWVENAQETGGTLTIGTASQGTYATLHLKGVYESSDFAATQVDFEDDSKHVEVNFVGALRWAKPVD